MNISEALSRKSQCHGSHAPRGNPVTDVPASRVETLKHEVEL
ncbi:hypothetical protein EDE11_10465 [Methylomonas methanica]|uniref:Uncharacterized protein n=1 Tax=Methylomonas methanica TaxID=421 RepID=A0ABY2CPS2_METMH|nr:hypothetical protein EDE11_10465 [Methylomonas methanica]